MITLYLIIITTMTIRPKKMVKLEAREKLKETILKLVDQWYWLTEISVHIGVGRNVITLISNKGKDYPISMEKIEKINILIKEKFLND